MGGGVRKHAPGLTVEADWCEAVLYLTYPGLREGVVDRAARAIRSGGHERAIESDENNVGIAAVM